MNRLHCPVVFVSGLIAFSGTAAFAQQVISARSGLIHYVEGRVLLDGKPVEVKLGAFPEVKENMELRTEDGRAEVLLNPGVFLRLAENSSVRMVTNKLSDSKVEFLSGSAIVEASSQLVQKENSVSILYKDSTTHLRKSGIYRFDSQPAEFRVYSGEAEVDSGSNVLTLKAGKMVSLDGLVAVEKFNPKEGDSLANWSERRGEYISMANVSAAKYANDSGSGSTYSNNGWYYNPYFGMFTYLPMNGMFYSPYGYPYYSPGVVYRVYQTAPRSTFTGTRTGFTGASSSYAAATTTSASALQSTAARATHGVGAFGGSGASVGGRSSGPSVGGGGGHMSSASSRAK